MRDIAAVSVRLIKMPLSVKAMTIPSPDGWFNVYINDRLTREEINEALEHEYDHILRGDFDSALPGHVLN